MPAPAAIRNAPKLELLRARTPSVSPRTVRHWEQGKYRIPDGVREEIEHLEAATAQAVTAGVDTYRDLPDPSVVPAPEISGAGRRRIAGQVTVTVPPELIEPSAYVSMITSIAMSSPSATVTFVADTVIVPDGAVNAALVATTVPFTLIRARRFSQTCAGDEYGSDTAIVASALLPCTCSALFTTVEPG